MKISSFRKFGALNSGYVFDAVESSLRSLGHEVVYDDANAEMYIIWSLLWGGRMSANKGIYLTAQERGIKTMILEVGMLRRNITWRVCLDCFKIPHTIIPRSHLLGVSLKPWTRSGDHILLCGQNSSSNLWDAKPPMQEWVSMVSSEIRQYTDRPIIFRPHPRDKTFYHIHNVMSPKHIIGTYDSFDFEGALDSAWIVVNPSSNPGPLAIINGVPAITGTHSMAHPMSTDISNIENPNYPDRTEWFEGICNTEWTLPELNNPEVLDWILTA